MAKSIMSHRVTRGSLAHQLKQALRTASSAARAQRTAALATTKANIGDEATFNAATRQEAELTAQICSKRRHRNRKDAPLTPKDKAVFYRASERQECEYRIADREDAEILRHRLQSTGVAPQRRQRGAVVSRARRAKRPAKKFVVAPRAAAALLSNPPPPPTAARAFSQCLAAINLLEVTCRSLDHQEIGQEQAALRCAQQAIWIAHDFLFGLQDDSDTDDDDKPDRGGVS